MALRCCFALAFGRVEEFLSFATRHLRLSARARLGDVPGYCSSVPGGTVSIRRRICVCLAMAGPKSHDILWDPQRGLFALLTHGSSHGLRAALHLQASEGSRRNYSLLFRRLVR